MAKASRPNKSVLVFADQAVNSATNFAFVAVIASNVSINTFGIFAIAQLTILIGQMSAQAGLGDILLRQPNRLATYRRASRLFTWATCILGLVASLMVVFFGLHWSFVAPLCAVSVIRLDHVRTFLVAEQRAKHALAMDGAYGAVQVGLAVILAATLDLTLAWVFAIWLVAALVAYLAVTTSRLLRDARASTPASTQVFSWRYASEAILIMGSGQASQLLASGALGLGFAAAVRGAQLAFGPVALLIQSSRLLLIPRFARPEDRDKRVVAAAAAALGVVTIVWLAIVLVTFSYLGPAILGETARLSQSLLIPVAATYTTMAIHMSLFMRARAQAADRQTSMSRALQVAGLFFGTGVAVLVGSGPVYLWGMAASSLIASIPLVRTHRLGVAPSDRRGALHDA